MPEWLAWLLLFWIVIWFSSIRYRFKSPQPAFNTRQCLAWCLKTLVIPVSGPSKLMYRILVQHRYNRMPRTSV